MFCAERWKLFSKDDSHSWLRAEATMHTTGLDESTSAVIMDTVLSCATIGFIASNKHHRLRAV
jgi:hypothetical protein